MNKFGILIRKELKDVLNAQMLVPMIIMVVMFYFLGDLVKSETGTKTVEIDSSISNSGTTQTVSQNMIIGLINNDNSETSLSVIDQMKAYGMTIITPDSNNPADAFKEERLKQLNIQTLIVFEPGFGDKLDSQQSSAEVKVYSYVDSFALMSSMSQYSAGGIIDAVNQAISYGTLTNLIGDKDIDINYIENPIAVDNFTVLNDKEGNIAPSELKLHIMSQTLFIPLVIFMLLMFASQALAMSMATEKNDKTLETLLTTPVSRLNILFSKMIASSISSVLMLVIFFFSYKNYMDGIMGGASASSIDPAILENFGITFDLNTYLIIGVQLVLSVLCALTIAMTIGILAEDIKNIQVLIMPVMIVLMIPFMLSMFLDINKLNIAAKILLYIIPFTHTFIATANIFTQNYALLIFGIAYQTGFVTAMLFITVRIFNSDKLFTLGTVFKSALMKKGKKTVQ